ncbi:MAG: malto-oligosyltrehalose synthase [Thermodesulfobacteriota bacterium]
MTEIPIATYRIQFNPSFTFTEAAAIVPYLDDLGVSDLYASPIFKSRQGSVHGYDVVDMNQINPDIGGMEGFVALTQLLRDKKMGWLQDVIPNHMAYDYENGMLMDVLENGGRSPYYRFFDIEWEHPYESIRGRLLAPFLGKFFGEALEQGEINLQYDRPGFKITYFGLTFPLKTESCAGVLAHCLEYLKERLGEYNPNCTAVLAIIKELHELSSQAEAQTYDQVRRVKKRLWDLYSNSLKIKECIDTAVEDFNGKAGSPESFNDLEILLSEQFYRLAFWKVANEEINYRRFFNINELISLRMEDEDVFVRTHSLIFRLLEERRITGLRIDHIDGLYDPLAYLTRTRERGGDAFLIVEKILDGNELLPSLWPVQGTTGYDFLNHVNGIFCQRRHNRSFNRIYSRFTGLKGSFGDLVAEKKRLVMGKHMAADIDNLALFMKGIAGRYRHGWDITLYGLRRALVEVMAQFPVYRTYVSHGARTEQGEQYIRTAVAKAEQSNPGLANELAFIEKFLLLRFDDYLSEENKNAWIDFVMRFQQFTGPLMAKGFEDTVLYVYNRLLSLNEVGGSPNKFGVSPHEFHTFLKRRFSLWPNTMNASATHDSKRGEDVRARINVLSELPQEWGRQVQAWAKLNRKKKKRIKGQPVPEKNDEYFLYQTLIGALPFSQHEYPSFMDRLKDYLIKSVREAKVHTAWLKPDTSYEDAFISFVEDILTQSEDNQFLHQMLTFQKKVAYYGMFNSISQTLIKIASPGVPDFYQGTELWDFSMVDPDNRRPVDFGKRAGFLRDIRKEESRGILRLIDELLLHKEDARIKLFVIYRGLQARAKHRLLFQQGRYIPLKTAGRFKNHIIAFARNLHKSWAVAVVPRFLTSLIEAGELPLGMEVWKDTAVVLPKRIPVSWKNALSDQPVEGARNLDVGEMLTYLPVSLLISEEEKS